MRAGRLLILAVATGGMLAGVLAALLWMLGAGSSAAQQGTMHNCPLAGKWAISVWDGPDGTDTGQALATCGTDAATAAYYIDPGTQAWLRYFVGRVEVSNLLTLNHLQGVVVAGGTGAPTTPTPAASAATTHTPTKTPTATPTRTPTPTATPTPTPTAASTPTPEVEHQLTMVADPPEGGTTIPSPGAHSYAHGATVQVSAIPTTDWWFVYWSTGCTQDDHDATTSVHMNADKTCIASFAACPPLIQGTYHGSVLLNGEPAPDGTLIEAFVGGIEWSEDETWGGGQYVLDVPEQSPMVPPCFEGGQITFHAGGVICTPQPEWQSGLQTVDLTCVGV